MKKGMKEIFAKRFGQKISAMMGKSKVSTFAMKQKNGGQGGNPMGHRATVAIGRISSKYPSQISGAGGRPNPLINSSRTLHNRDSSIANEERKDVNSQDVSNDVVTDNSLMNSFRNEKGELISNRHKHRLTVVSRQSKNNFDQLTQNTMAQVLLRKQGIKSNLGQFMA